MIKNRLLKIYVSFIVIVLGSTILYALPVNPVSTESAIKKIDRFERIHLNTIFAIKDMVSLEELSDVIIKAEVLAERENLELLEGSYGFTKTKLKVTKVYSGNLKVDDIIVLGEEYFQYTDNNTGEVCMQAINLYEPTIIGDEYIFFLFDKGEADTARENVYEIINITDGKFPVPKKTIKTQSSDVLSNSEINIGDGDISKYKKIYNEVIKKYN
ncbi:hypothetical protein [Cellulosilyticum sp. I15G10I2]|uniref:hypothetical protein n=1 Tax=Cellulosilyticum sp. I15G10I2 TaxID=1892843 RepID=UPI00085CC71E|nr:hypothetical protein [Cellulosilyticum sp. I15G10I2]